MQGRLWQPAISTHDHKAQSEIKSVWFYQREENWRALRKNLCGIGENQHTTLLTCGLDWKSNRGHVGERRALYTQANQAIHKCIWITTRWWTRWQLSFWALKNQWSPPDGNQPTCMSLCCRDSKWFQETGSVHFMSNFSRPSSLQDESKDIDKPLENLGVVHRVQIIELYIRARGSTCYVMHRTPLTRHEHKTPMGQVHRNVHLQNVCCVNWGVTSVIWQAITVVSNALWPAVSHDFARPLVLTYNSMV